MPAPIYGVSRRAVSKPSHCVLDSSRGAASSTSRWRPRFHFFESNDNYVRSTRRAASDLRNFRAWFTARRRTPDASLRFDFRTRQIPQHSCRGASGLLVMALGDDETGGGLGSRGSVESLNR